MTHKNIILKFGTLFAEHPVYGNWLDLFENTPYTFQLPLVKFDDIFEFNELLFMFDSWYRYDMNRYR
jgi:hypothetical protein